jgi:hypothetical protein
MLGRLSGLLEVEVEGLKVSSAALEEPMDTQRSSQLSTDAQTLGEEPGEIQTPPELVACLTAPLADAKEILAACDEAEIPATLARQACGKPGCSPQFELLVAPADVPEVMQLLRDRWRALLEREGVTEAGRFLEATVGDDPRCPACGKAAPLVEGACSDCGLQLE